MKKIKYLALTDHSAHSKENSLYALMRTLNAHPNTAEICVVSRGDKRNRPFFTFLNNKAELFGLKVDEKFDFQADGKNFTNSENAFELKDFDVVLLRLPPPVTDDFLYFLEDVAKGKIIINSPHGIRLTSTKKYLLHFPELCPEMKLVRSQEELRNFATRFSTVIKPLKEYGGKGIVKIENGRVFSGEEEMSLEEYLSIINVELQTDGFLAMKFLKNVKQGDKRILVVNGKIMASSLRLPPEGSWLCNVAQGGQSIASEADADEINIIKKITPFLREEGVLIFGADALTDDNGKRILSEINTLSIGGFPQAEKQTGRPILRETIDLIVEYVKSLS
ncbi:MAG: glutathione synthase [Saprospiraceae bacterium]|jgi:glutathione synthase